MASSSSGPNKRASLSSPPRAASSCDQDALFQRLLETAGIDPVTNHLSSISPPHKSPSELLVIDRVLPPSMMASARTGLVERLLGTIDEMNRAENCMRQANIKAQKLWRALDPSVSPISQLPDDLLLIIFEFGAMNEVARMLAHTPDGHESGTTVTARTTNDTDRPGSEEGLTDLLAATPFPMLVSHVCGNWRSLAVERSSLWTRVRPFWDFDQIWVWMKRSKNQPLHIDMLDAREQVPLYNMEVMRDHCERWKSISLTLSAPTSNDGTEEALIASYATLLSHGHVLDKPPQIVLPALTWLSISSSIPVRLPITDYSLFPRLETLRLHRVGADSLENLFERVVTAQVDLSGLFTWNWAGIGAAQRLTSLTIRSPHAAQDQENDLEGSEAPWSIPSLRHLCIDLTPRGVCRSLLALLKAPGLESLSINLRGKDLRTKRAILDFALAHPSVTTVQLYGTPSDAFHILSPSTLPPRSSNPTSPVPDTSLSPFPRLRTLTLAKMPYLSIDLDDLKLLRRFLLSRSVLAVNGSHTRLHTLRLDRTILEAFRAASRAGGGAVSMGMEGSSEDTFFEDWEDDEDYDEGVDFEADGFTDADGATDFEEEPEPEPPVVAAGVDADVDELEEETQGAVDEDPSDSEDFSIDIEAADEDADDSSEGSDDDELELDEADEANVAAHVSAPVASSEPEEEDELASNGPSPSSESEEPEDGEEWIRRHVDVLEAVDYDWRTENP